MSRGGRPSERGGHKRNLIGPKEILRQIDAKGGVPDDVIEGLKAPRPENPRASAANEAAAVAVKAATEMVAGKGISHETLGSFADPADDPNAIARKMAWIISVTTAMKETVPRKKWCRHMRAADPHLNELRTVAALSAGVWMCVECMKQAGEAVLRANPWPEECDLCGATMTVGHFNEMAFNIPGCFVNCTVCDDCYAFRTAASK